MHFSHKVSMHSCMQLSFLLFVVCFSQTMSHHPREPLDWSSSSFGLFIGLLGLVTSTVVLILYFALVNQDDLRFFAILANNISDTIINTMMIVAMVIGFFQIKNLELVGKYQNCYALIFHMWLQLNCNHCNCSSDDSGRDYDGIMITTAFGILVYSTFNIIAGSLNDNSFEPGICGSFKLMVISLLLLPIFHSTRRTCSGQRTCWADSSDNPTAVHSWPQTQEDFSADWSKEAWEEHCHFSSHHQLGPLDHLQLWNPKGWSYT